MDSRMHPAVDGTDAPDRESYSRFVQRVQSEAQSFGMENRVRATHHEDGKIDASFEVYWDEWEELGHEWDAMTPNARRCIFPERWDRIVAEATVALLK